MRMLLAILLCKLGRAVGKLVGKGSSLPGKLAILRADGKQVVYNAEGSNQIEGVATMVLTHASLGGRVRADVLLIESDERYAAHTFRFFHPTLFVITNLYRDQLTRNGHPEWVYDSILPSLHPETVLLLNADDPLSSCFARGRQNVKWFGLDRCSVSSDAPSGVYHDGAFCPVCRAPMEYDYAHYNQIGAFRCTNPECGHQKHSTDYTVTAVDLENRLVTIGHDTEVKLAFGSIYNIYNILSAYAACRECGVGSQTAAGVLSNYLLKNGRMQTFRLGQRHGTLLTSKHENSIAYDTNIRYIAASGKDCVVLLIVDAVSRKYFTSETSWLWDIDFDRLQVPHVKKIILSGRYCCDLAERFSFTALENWEVQPDIAAAAESLKNGGEDVFVLTCFSDRDKILCHVEKEG